MLFCCTLWKKCCVEWTSFFATSWLWYLTIHTCVDIVLQDLWCVLGFFNLFLKEPVEEYKSNISGDSSVMIYVYGVIDSACMLMLLNCFFPVFIFTAYLCVQMYIHTYVCAVHERTLFLCNILSLVQSED
jgi:hypothetical protein